MQRLEALLQDARRAGANEAAMRQRFEATAATLKGLLMAERERGRAAQAEVVELRLRVHVLEEAAEQAAWEAKQVVVKPAAAEAPTTEHEVVPLPLGHDEDV